MNVIRQGREEDGLGSIPESLTHSRRERLSNRDAGVGHLKGVGSNPVRHGLWVWGFEGAQFILWRLDGVERGGEKFEVERVRSIKRR